MSVIALGSLGLGINMWLCQVKDSTFYNSATEEKPKKNCRLATLSFAHKLTLQTTENTKHCLPHKGMNMAEETVETVGYSWSRVEQIFGQSTMQ